MSESNPQSQRTPGGGEMVYCHECQDEWYRDEFGLQCPSCESDFTEIIEENHDPRDYPPREPYHESDDDDDDDQPDIIPTPVELARNHNDPLNDPFDFIRQHHPWRDQPDPDEGDISNLQFRQTGPGSFALTGTIYRSISPSGRGNANQPNIQNPLMNSFATMLNQIVGRGVGARQGSEGQDGEGGGETGGHTRSGVTPGGHRFTYTSSARLFPRDSDNPGPRIEPVDELHNSVLMGLLHTLGEAPAGEEQDGQDAHHMHPLVALLGQMMPGNAHAGDFVYSQEGLDRIISQLMEQNASGNAPGPAPQEDIDKLPKKPVDEGMLGAEGRAECSICMDEVNIGEQVVELPCQHWFHQQCVAVWLAEHDTCPHCRKGISSKPQENNIDPVSPMPGGFAGEGTASSPNAEERTQQRTSGDRPTSSGDSSGLGERLRRNLFGAPR